MSGFDCNTAQMLNQLLPWLEPLGPTYPLSISLPFAIRQPAPSGSLAQRTALEAVQNRFSGPMTSTQLYWQWIEMHHPWKSGARN